MTNDPELKGVRTETVHHDPDTDSTTVAVEVHFEDEDGHYSIMRQLAHAGGPGEVNVTVREISPVDGPRLTLTGAEWIEP